MVITPFQKFFEVLKTPATRKTYQIQMRTFFGYAHTDYDNIVKLPISQIEDLVFEYIVHLKDLTARTGRPSPNSYRAMITPIQTFLEMNEILLNWRRLKRYYPDTVPLSNQLPYQTKHIQLMLDTVNCSRDRAFVHILACAGVRIGAIYDMTCGDIHYIENGAVVTVYKNTKSEHRICLTPEATTAMKDYLSTRMNTESNDPLFTVRNNSRKLTDSSIKDVMKRLRNRIGLNEGNGKRSKNAYSANHAFRKRVEIVFSKAGIEESFKKYLTNHDMTVSVYHYFRGISDEDLYNEFKKAIPELTVNDTERLKQKHELEKQALTQKIPEQFKEKLESIEGQLVEMKKERAGKVIEFYDDLAERKGVEDIAEIKTKLDDTQIDEITEARKILNQTSLEITPSQDMLRRKYLISKQESVISSLKKELEELADKVPKRKSPDKMTDEEFDSLEDYEDKLLEIELAEEFLVEMKKRK